MTIHSNFASDAAASALVAAQNDMFRRTMGWGGDVPGRAVLTSGLTGVGRTFVGKAVRAAVAFNAFDPEDDPYGERDFGAFDADGERIFFEIDYYDKNYEYDSEYLSNISQTCYALTLMLSREYYSFR